MFASFICKQYYFTGRTCFIKSLVYSYYINLVKANKTRVKSLKPTALLSAYPYRISEQVDG